MEEYVSPNFCLLATCSLGQKKVLRQEERQSFSPQMLWLLKRYCFGAALFVNSNLAPDKECSISASLIVIKLEYSG
jgi:hypothetical protein